ncbi:MAG: hypothetical protein ABI311_00295 [Gemmatimonadaceae bacterium]
MPDDRVRFPLAQVTERPFGDSPVVDSRLSRELASDSLFEEATGDPNTRVVRTQSQRQSMFRSSTLIAVATFAGALAASPLLAQQDTVHHGGVNGAARAVSGTLKTVGRDAKAGTKAVASKTHHVLKKAGRGAKSSLAHATGDTIHDPNHKPGGLNKVARDVSGSIKHAGRTAKADVHSTANDAHKSLQKTGNAVKKSVKDTTGHS